MGDAVSEGLRWTLILVFALALLEKISVLGAGTAAWHPMIVLSERRRRHATSLMAAASASDAATIMLLLIWAPVGALASASLIAVYSTLALGMRNRAEGCRCFWKVLDATSLPTLLVRNLALSAMSAAILFTPTALWTIGSIGAGLGMFGVLVAGTALADRIFRPLAGYPPTLRGTGRVSPELGDEVSMQTAGKASGTW